MNCNECRATNPEESRYCNQCGTVLGRSLEETVQKKLRDRKVIESEITESVAKRLMTWAGWVRNTIGIVVALFAILIGLSYLDFRKDVRSAREQIGAEVTEVKKDIEAAKLETTGLHDDLKKARSEVQGYEQTNAKIASLQKELLQVKGQVIDLGSKTLKVGRLETANGTGHPGIEFGTVGCDPVEKGNQLMYCAQGSPPVLIQESISGESAPVASRSPIGFQDISTGAKPPCAARNRGTFYVEKGATDKPFLCAQKSAGTYAWMELAIR
jgi:hypothetical protein